ncbi:MAG: D-alanyl-D-alanine carboxypeptidase family protein [Roseburia sp.]
MFQLKRGKKAVAMLLGVLCMLQVAPQKIEAADYWPEGPSIETPSAIVMEVSTGTVLYEKNAEEQLYPASITKILTTLVAIENSSMDEIVTFSEEAVYLNEGDTSHIWRDVGEQMTMEQCLYAIMLESANECAWAVAEHVAGDVPTFVDMMNEKAKELGCTNTHFNNPNGLPDEEHWTCAKDMAIIARAAYENETFRIITGTARYTIPVTNKHAEPTYLQNHNEMLYPRKTTEYVYEYCTGGKTGYTIASGSTLVTYAEKDGMALVCVVMNTQSPLQWTDSTSLFEYCFDNFQVWNIAENETRFETENKESVGALNTNEVFASMDQDACIVLPKTAEFSDTTYEISYENTSDTVAGTIAYTYNDRAVGGADILISEAEVKEFPFDNVKETEEEESRTLKIDPVKVILVLVGILVLVALFFGIRTLIDNMYIIRHKLEIRKYRKEQKNGRKKERNVRNRWKKRRK